MAEVIGHCAGGGDSRVEVRGDSEGKCSDLKWHETT